MFLGGDSPRKAANFGIPKRGNFGIPKWDFFFGPTRRAFAGGNRPAVSDVFLSGSAASGRINCARLALLVKLEGRAFGQTECPERQACSIAQRAACETRGCPFR
jgi:hypothetical protein